MMLLHTDGKPLKTPLRALSVLVFLLLLTHHCRGQSQLIGSYQPIVANLGGDIILPCYLVPAINAADLTLEWTRPDMDPRFVHVIRLRHELVDKKHKLFKGRTSMFTDELKNGNISLKLSNVQLSDQGKYRCFIPELDRQAFVQLVCVSAAARPPVVTLSGLDGQRGGVVLQCESAGWYPEPEVLWLDAEGKLLSAGPPETVRGPDDLYTVSSRVTVEKRPSSSFTCRVQHHNTTRTTQTHFHVPDDFFKLQSSYSSIIIGLAVSLSVCILLMLATFFFLWRELIFKTKRKHSDEVDKGVKKNRSKTKDQFLNEGERGQLMKPDAVQMEALKGNVEKKSKPKNQSEQQLLEEQRRREEAEKEVQTLKEQLQNKKKEVESKESELQDLHAEKQRNEKELQSLKGELENKNRETSEREEQKKKAEQEVETLKKELESRQKETDTNIREVERLHTDLQRGGEEKGRREEEMKRLHTDLQRLTEEKGRREEEMKKDMTERQKITDQKLADQLKKEKELKETQSLLEIQRTENSREKTELNDQLLAEKKRGEEARKPLKELQDQNKEFEKKLQEEKRGREEAEKELKDLKEDVESKMQAVRYEEQQEGVSSENQTSDSGFNIDFDQRSKYIWLRNKSTKYKQMSDWVLHLQVNDNDPSMYTFQRSFKLEAGRDVTIRVPDQGHSYSDTELEWCDLKPWSSGDRLKFTLDSHTGKKQYVLCMTST